MLYALAVVMGLIIGSFLNVCIYRLPRNISLSRPVFSFCPQCGHRLYPKDLIPVISFIFLAGKCRYCKNIVSIRYVLVEVLTGFLFGLVYHYYQDITVFPVLLFVSALIALTFIDLEHKIIPDKLNYFTGAAGIILGLLTGYQSLISMALGFIVGFGLLLLVCVLSRGGMGGGDIKLAGVMGIYLGWQLTLLALFIGFLAGGLFGLYLLLAAKKSRKEMVPFGPFLALGSLIALLWGQGLLDWYFSFLLF